MIVNHYIPRTSGCSSTDLTFSSVIVNSKISSLVLYWLNSRFIVYIIYNTYSMSKHKIRRDIHELKVSEMSCNISRETSVISDFSYTDGKSASAVQC